MAATNYAVKINVPIYTIVFIPTCKRPDKLRALLSDLDGQPCKIFVFQDGIFDGYKSVREDFPETIWRIYDVPHGRELYWQLINDSFQTLKRYRFKHVIYLGDDLRVSKTFVCDALTEFKRSGADALNLSNDGRAGETQWGIEYRGEVNGFYHTNWLDMCFVADRKFFDRLNWIVKPIYRNWKTGVLLGSGVGKQISKRTIERGGKIYQVIESLVQHGGHESVMNGERTEPLVTENKLSGCFDLTKNTV